MIEIPLPLFALIIAGAFAGGFYLAAKIAWIGRPMPRAGVQPSQPWPREPSHYPPMPTVQPPKSDALPKHGDKL